LRELLYQAFMDPLVEADYVKVNLYDDLGRVRYLVGYTEKFETEIFDVETMTQISMICPDPYLRDDSETVVSNVSSTPNAWVATTTYASGNQVRHHGACYTATSLAGNVNKPPATSPTYWTIISSGGWTTVPFAYDGTAETGFQATIYINALTSVVTLENNPVTSIKTDPNYYKGRMIIDRSPGAFAVGDLIRVNTVRGSRSLTIQGSFPESSIVANLTPSSPWLELHSKSNTMRVYGSTSSDLVASILDLSYIQSYWGI
jgi:hypothetical protein